MQATQTAPKRDTLTTATPKQSKKKASAKASKSAEKVVDDALKAILANLEDSKAEDIVTIDIRDKTAIADYMVVASGRSKRHVAATSDTLVRHMKSLGTSARIEGMQNADWVLSDFGDIIVHIFRPEVREFYSLEKMWQMTDIPDTHK
ncbi:MAG: ribosome silencing factor [Rhizobiaceae bacterium]|nr:ribosome silencing factor [Rhizobiaceae bacterium]